jgi:hypothetical protein
MRGWCVTVAREHAESTSWIPRELRSCGITLRNCGTRPFQPSTELQKKNIKRRNGRAPEAAQSKVVKKTLHVTVPIEKAFQVFAQRMGTWWPARHHIGGTAFQEVIVDPRAGGRWFERDAKGAECEWGSVIAWKPPKKLVLAWHLQPDFKYSPDPAHTSEVVVEFIADGQESTRVEFEHRHIERHGEGWEKMRTSVDSGWGQVLAGYVAAAK